MLLSVFLDRGVIPYAQGGGQVHAPSLDLSNYQVVHPGDFVLNNQQAWRGSVGVSAHNGIISPAYIVLELSKVLNPTYANFLFRSPAMVAQYVTASKGVGDIQRQIYWPYLRLVQVPLPPPDEQAAIVRYLDHMDRRIRRYIRARRRLIALLGEQKQAIIHQAVTRGLDPSVPLKPSGVEWLGDVPAHWEVTSVRRLISFITSGSRGWARFYSDTGDLFVQSGNLGRSMNLDFRRLQHVSVPLGAEGERTRIEQGDVLVCITGALTGNVAHVDYTLPPAYINQHVALLRPLTRRVLSRYLAYVLHSRTGQEQFKLTEYGGTKQGLGLDDVRNVYVALPNLEEQQRTVLALDAELSQLSRTIQRVEREIDLIREYRTRLIADVVTGKVDVRAAAASLPAEFDAPGDALDDAGAEDADLDEDTPDDGGEEE